MNNDLKELLEYYSLYVYENKTLSALEIAETPDSLTFMTYYQDGDIAMRDYRNASKDNLLKAMTVINLFNSNTVHI